MRQPLLYELNARWWLGELSKKYSRPVTLDSVPEAEVAAWQDLGFTHIWLMGVWATGPLARSRAWSELKLLGPEYGPEAVGGSPYAIADYHVGSELGGDAALNTFRQQLSARGLKLVLDFVPNHLGLDHPWVVERPELFVQSKDRAPEHFQQQTRAGMRWLAHGKDPNFAAWTDTVQLDYRRPETHRIMIELLQRIAGCCDGVRCDMAMLLLNDVFNQTWPKVPTLQAAVSPGPARSGAGALPEFWASAILAVKRQAPGFLFLAEAYWGLEPRLQALGFDFTYDKDLLDKILARAPAAVQRHVYEMRPGALAQGAHFLENHDEPRIASLLSFSEHRAAALLVLALPGMRFLHQGQLTGARRKAPVQLVRSWAGPDDPRITALYENLLQVLNRSAVGQGKGELLRPRAAWQDNPTAQNFVIVQWQAQPDLFDLVVINLATHPSQCVVSLNFPNLSSCSWSMQDLLSDEQYVRPGLELQNHGLFLDVPANAAQLFQLQPQP